MSPWPAAVAAEPKTLHMLLDADARLAAAAGGVARFLADEAGLETGALARLQLAVVDACKEDFKHLSGNHAHLDVAFTRFSDRLEVSLSYQDEKRPTATPQASESSTAQKGNIKGNSTAFPGVDRIQYETHGKEIITRLTKYFA